MPCHHRTAASCLVAVAAAQINADAARPGVSRRAGTGASIGWDRSRGQERQAPTPSSSPLLSSPPAIRILPTALASSLVRRCIDARSFLPRILARARESSSLPSVRFPGLLALALLPAPPRPTPAVSRDAASDQAARSLASTTETGDCRRPELPDRRPRFALLLHHQSVEPH